MRRLFSCIKRAPQAKAAAAPLRLRIYFEGTLHDTTYRQNSTWRSSNLRITINLKAPLAYGAIFNTIRRVVGQRWPVDYCIPSTSKVLEPRWRPARLYLLCSVFDLGCHLATCYQQRANQSELLGALQLMVLRARFTGIIPWASLASSPTDTSRASTFLLKSSRNIQSLSRKFHL